MVLDENYGKSNVDVLQSKIRDWNRHKTQAHASDLVGSSIVLGREKDAVDAARFLLLEGHDVGPWKDRLAQSVLSSGEPVTEEFSAPKQLSELQLRHEIRTLRQHLKSEAKDSISWVDLSRAYTALGQEDQAVRCMNIALNLAGDNRFVLRAATRFWVHLNDPGKAHNIILRYCVSKFDPWLLAAEIATGEAAHRTPRYTKISRKILNNTRLKATHTSELASALATLELGSGNVKKARKLFARSLIGPTENSIAQAAWATRKGYTVGFNDSYFIQYPNTYEAQSWTYFHECQWAKVIEQCTLWQFDQPFSSVPGTHGSYVAAVAMEDYITSRGFAEQGLIANQHDWILLNNLAFAQINLGDLSDARRTLSRINKARISKWEATTIKATEGLLHFREGKSELGRRYYEEAIADAKAQNDSRLQGIALSFYAKEELSCGRDKGRELVMRALDSLRRVKDPCVTPLRARLEKSSTKLRTPETPQHYM